MENNSVQTGSSTWNQNPSNGQIELPNSLGALIVGIVSLVCSTLLICCYGSVPGLIGGIVGMVLGSMAMKSYKANPEMYTEKSFKNARAGKIMSLLSIIFSGILLLVGIIFFILGMAISFSDMMNNMK